MLAIEWIWLFIGTAAVFAHLVEAWASPYLPAVWMLGVLVLFLVYRLGMAIRQLYWPQPEVEESEASGSFSQGIFGGVAGKNRRGVAGKNKRGVAGTKKRGGDGMVSTTEWIPPQMRGRKVRPGRSQRRQALAERQKQQAQQEQAQPNQAQPNQTQPNQTQQEKDTLERGPLQIPSASGRFDGAEIATVFAEVEDDTDPLPTSIVDAGVPFEATSIVELDRAELRPETDADLSQDELVIPAFAESALTREQRQRALEAVADSEPTLKRRAPTRPDQTPAQPSPQPPAQAPRPKRPPAPPLPRPKQTSSHDEEPK